MTYRENYLMIIDELMKKAPSFQNIGAAGYHPGLQTMIDFDDFLGNPHLSFKSIHIAGTNGKGSVAHFMAALLAAKGYRTGLYTSPHLVDFRERIKTVERNDETGDITCTMIPEDDVLTFLSSASTFISGRTPSFFEITTAMAFDWFKNQNVDFAVVECGLGGRLDSTNIITPVLSIITAIGFDHKDILGGTIEKIASEKAGIIKRNVPVVLGKMPDEAVRVISDTASGMMADVFYAPDFSGHLNTAQAQAIGSIDVTELDLQCTVQHLNLQTVAKSADVLLENGIISPGTDMISSVTDALRHTGASTGLRGRWETLCEHPRILCDIGHNENALLPVMTQLKQTFNELHPAHFFIIYGMAGDKDIASVIHLLPRNAKYIFTNARGRRALPAQNLKDLVTSGWKNRNDLVTNSVEEAVSVFFEMASPDDLLYIGGSSYVVAEAIPIIEEKLKTKKPPM